jgi:hypothetical protein
MVTHQMAVELIGCYSREDTVRELIAVFGCQTAFSAKTGRFARNKTVQNLEAWQEGYRPIELFVMERQWMPETALCRSYCWKGWEWDKVGFRVHCTEVVYFALESRMRYRSLQHSYSGAGMPCL